MTKIKELVTQLDEEINHVYDRYMAHFKELEPYRGRFLEEHEIDSVATILKNIQDTFEELYDALHFIAYRHTFAVKVTHDHQRFIESFKKKEPGHGPLR
jgi:septation ring formation regulator EzrA